MKKLIMAGAALCALTTTAHAQQGHHEHHNHAAHMSASGNMHNHDTHVSTAPISVMGDHTHNKGDWMISYTAMRMVMDGNRDGTDDLSPLEISGDFPNVTGVGPATLRIVPTHMEMDMHMLGGMVGITDNITLMAMANYLNRKMDHITYAGANPDLRLGTFTTESQGWGDTKIAALYNAYQNQNHNIVAKLGISLPTGSIDETDDILNPMNARQTVRLPYAMQLGSGTYDLEPAITYTTHYGNMDFGAQYSGVIRLGENDEDYTLGDKHTLTGWGSYKWNSNVSNSLRLSFETESDIDGRDTNIAGPVQTANPDNYGGQRAEAGLGIKGNWNGHTLGAEVAIPLYQDLNGPQMKRDYAVTLGYQYSF